MKNKVKLKGNLKAYLRWPLLLSALLICMNISIYAVDKDAGIIMSIYLAIYVVISMILYYYKVSTIQGELIRFAADYGQVQKQLLKELTLPYALLDLQGHLLWGNNEFLDIILDEKMSRRGIHNIFPEITKDTLPQADHDSEIHITYEDMNYKVVMRRIVADSFYEDYSIEDAEESNKYSDPNSLIAIYLYDETEITTYIRENKEQRLIVGLLYIDNYEEALETIDEVRRSLLVALVDRKVNKFMQSIDAIVKKLEKDKYIILFKQKYLPQLQSNKFNILDEVRSVNIGNDIAVTISIGLGISEDSYNKGYEYARAAIDLALGRGGDQAVIKEGEKLSYYGGKNIQIEKNTRVKARVKAHALRELVEAKDKVVIMGHSIGDVDSLGAAIGVYRIAKTLNKKAHIVFNEVTTSVRPLMNRFLNNPEYEEDMFLRNVQAMNVVDNNTLLVVVDVNKPNYTECAELLNFTKTIVILDHHRQSGDNIENAVLSYIEPYASSTCEMVAEVLQYIGDVKLRQAEADAMYSGIMLDTNNFLTMTGVRTFEAAAYLRRNGADVTRIRKSFRSNMDEFRTRAFAISQAELFLDHYAITECPNDQVDSPTVVGAQVANELLNITDVKASFVFTALHEKVYISARAIDEMNVQVIMEKFGGGGHINVAGAQMKDCTVEEGIEILKSILSEMKEEGDI
ncbi:c-di-AMP phosphodiesterase-like protein [Mobilisporobacter senegalensis]|uniref:Cyclic-di-AMP phosphodiesterase n=1 Tax=Mobilisporobacter senegalensis TaxID=1329262 RepID=A0A3N1XLX0_9FIRM|nr:DHH family phosphoesterase [Mobilisporobacter senegalensis]ROR25717.1 c-di-AMP phosphodiesterase-like protein [Mobilisporobacter senegalensis]